MDKILHFLLAFMIALAVGGVTESSTLGLVAGLIAGAGKEILDSLTGGTVELLEKEFDHNGAAGCLHWALPVIYINPTDPPTTSRVLRHEYQHYMQCAILSPLGVSIAYSFEHYILGHDYNKNWFELDAERVEHDDLVFKVFDWQTKKIMEVKP